MNPPHALARLPTPVPTTEGAVRLQEFARFVDKQVVRRQWNEAELGVQLTESAVQSREFGGSEGGAASGVI